MVSRRVLLKLLGSSAAVLSNSASSSPILKPPEPQTNPDNPPPSQRYAIRQFKAPGAAYAVQVRALLAQLKSHIASGRPFPISQIVSSLPLNPIGSDVITSLIARGNVSFKDGRAVSVARDPSDADFGDATFGRISVSFPANVEAGIKILDGRVLFDFAAQPVTVLFSDFPTKYRIASNQQLTLIDYGDQQVSYTLQETINTRHQTLILVDLSLKADQSTPLSRNPDTIPHYRPASSSNLLLREVSYYPEAQTNKESVGQAIVFVGAVISACCFSSGGKESQKPTNGPTGYPAHCIFQRSSSYYAVLVGNPFHYDGRGGKQTQHIGETIDAYKLGSDSCGDLAGGTSVAKAKFTITAITYYIQEDPTTHAIYEETRVDGK